MGTRSIGRLSALKFARLREMGRHCDGGGLYLQIGKGSARSWIFRYQLNGQARDMGLGSAEAIGLSDARDFAAQCRALVARGIDPLEERRRKAQAAAIEAARAETFEHCARALIKSKEPGWRHKKQAAQWVRSLETYAFPVIGQLPLDAIDAGLVLKVIEPIWQTKTVTAGRVRERIEAILDAAKARGLRNGENPARWRGHLDSLLPSPSKIRSVKHHPALPYAEMPTFYARLKDQEGISARALECLILTAARSGEILGARWEEFDLENAVWTVPSTRIKAAKEHKIPLSVPALSVLTALHNTRCTDYVFPGRKLNRPMCHLALAQVLRRMGRADITPHGFRSTFRDWTAERTGFPHEVAEMALAHAITNNVEAAYRRGSLFDKRARLMSAWAAFCCNARDGNTIVPFDKRSNGAPSAPTEQQKNQIWNQN